MGQRHPSEHSPSRDGGHGAGSRRRRPTGPDPAESARTQWRQGQRRAEARPAVGGRSCAWGPHRRRLRRLDREWHPLWASAPLPLRERPASDVAVVPRPRDGHHPLQRLWWSRRAVHHPRRRGGCARSANRAVRTYPAAAGSQPRYRRRWPTHRATLAQGGRRARWSSSAPSRWSTVRSGPTPT